MYLKDLNKANPNHYQIQVSLHLDLFLLFLEKVNFKNKKNIFDAMTTIQIKKPLFHTQSTPIKQFSPIKSSTPPQHSFSDQQPKQINLSQYLSNKDYYMQKTTNLNVSTFTPNSCDTIKNQIQDEIQITKQKAILYSEIYPQVLDQLMLICKKVEADPKITYDIDWTVVKQYLNQEQQEFVIQQLDKIKQIQLDQERDEFYQVFYEVHQTSLNQEAFRLWEQVKQNKVEKSQWKNFIFIKMK